MEQVQGFKQESDVMRLVLRAHTWLLVKSELKGHIVGKGDWPGSKFSAMKRGGGHPT